MIIRKKQLKIHTHEDDYSHITYICNICDFVETVVIEADFPNKISKNSTETHSMKKKR